MNPAPAPLGLRELTHLLHHMNARITELEAYINRLVERVDRHEQILAGIGATEAYEQTCTVAAEFPNADAFHESQPVAAHARQFINQP